MTKNDDDKSLRELILSVKTELINSNKKTLDEIKESINGIKVQVDDNTAEIANLSARIDILERKKKDDEVMDRHMAKTYKQAILTDPIEHGRKKVLEEARKIVGIKPVTDLDIEEYTDKGMGDKEALEEAAKDFLRLELKFDQQEIEDLRIIRVTRPQKEGTERLYLHLENEESSRYLYRKTSQVKNENVGVAQFIPPQLFHGHNELSRLTFIKRKEDEKLKTQIRLGDKDLILLTKDRDEKDWSQQKDIEIYGQLPDPEWFKLWPLKSMPIITSPAKGRPPKKNVHNISRDSGEERSPKIQKKKGVSNIAEYFDRRDRLRKKSKE